MSDDGTLRYACTMCGARATSGGACPKCNADAMMDILDPDQRQVLVREDERRMRTRSNQLKAAAVFGGIALGGIVFIGLLRMGYVPFVAGSTFIAGGLWAALEHFLSDARRFPFLDDPLPKARIAKRRE